MQEFPIPFMIFQHFIRMIEHILFSNIFGFCEWEYIRFKKFLKTFLREIYLWKDAQSWSSYYRYEQIWRI